MPNNIRAILSVLVAVVTAVVFFLEHGSNDGTLQWLALGLGLFMIGAIWLFPEAKGIKDR